MTNTVALELRMRDVADSDPKGLIAEAADALNDQRKELEYWRKVAAYLASCHAATAEYDGQLSGISRSRKERYASICHTAAQAMQPFGWSHYRYETPEDAKARCLAAMTKLRERK